MCGIYGIIERNGCISEQALILSRDRLRHRGPDDAGVWLSEDRTIGLAHRRLSILDLSPAGRQPMISTDGRLVIVFNGEIYNFLELKAELGKSSFGFTTRTDTEVLLAAYRIWGDKMLSRLNGMFAFAILDRGNERVLPSLFFARDRTGKKPFYYVQSSDGFEFASELKALSHRGGLDTPALNYYLALGYVPRSMCISQGVNKLPPAHAGRLDLQSYQLKVWRYWSLPANIPDCDVSGEVLADEAGHLLEDSTRLRLQSDVPIGVLLSGGLDSSLITAAAAHVSSTRIKTFNIALPGSALDESHHARLVAEYFGTEHHVLPLEVTGLSALDDFAPLVDEPVGDSSILPALLVSGLTRSEVTVALGGDGGDELFGGYEDYPRTLRDIERFSCIPPSLFAVAASVAATLPAGVRGRNRIASMRGGPAQQMIWGRPYFDIALRRRLLGEDALAQLGKDIEAPERFLQGLFESGSDTVDRMTRTHFGSILPDDFLAKVDRASMAMSLEMRAPLLDYRLVEFAFSKIPGHWKVHAGETRRVERILARRWLPATLDVHRKQGFSIPLDAWLRQASCGWFDGLVDRLPPSIRRDEVRSLIIGLHRGRANGSRLFALAMLGHACSNLGF